MSNLVSLIQMRKRSGFQIYSPVLISLCGFIVSSCGLISGNNTVAEAVVSDPKNQTLLVQNSTKGVTFCFDKFSSDAGKCSGVYRIKSKTQDFTFAEGSCSYSGLVAEAKAKEKIDIRCVNSSDNKSCFVENGLPELVIDKESEVPFSNGVWGAVESPTSDYVQIRKETSCQKAFEAIDAAKAGNGSNSSNTSGTSNSDDTCANQTTESGTAATSLSMALSSESQCFSLKDATQRASCLLRDMAMEVYDLTSVPEIEKVKAGTIKPNRCYVNVPPEESKEAVSLFVYQDPAGKFKGAVSLGGVITYHDEGSSPYFSTSFGNFKSTQPPTVSVSVSMRSVEVLYPRGEPDAKTGVWQMSDFRVVKFVPKDSCGRDYLSVQYPPKISTSAQSSSTADDSGGKSTQDENKNASCPKPSGAAK